MSEPVPPISEQIGDVLQGALKSLEEQRAALAQRAETVIALYQAGFRGVHGLQERLLRELGEPRGDSVRDAAPERAELIRAYDLVGGVHERLTSELQRFAVDRRSERNELASEHARAKGWAHGGRDSPASNETGADTSGSE